MVVFLAWPTTTMQSPMWDVWVVDQSGRPLQGMTVRLSYQNYSAESESHSEDLQTDAKGYVLFYPQTLRASRIRRALAIAQSATEGVHASFGPHAGVSTFGKGLEGDAVNDGHVTDWTGEPPRMSSKVAAKPRIAVIPYEQPYANLRRINNQKHQSTIVFYASALASARAS